MWSKLLTRCGETYFYAGSELDRAGRGIFFSDGERTPIEFRGAKFHVVAIRVTDAERLNGTSDHARITMLAHLFRATGKEWEDGPDLVVRSMSDILLQSSKDLRNDEDQMGAGGAIALDLLKFKGHWYVRRSSVALSGTVREGAPPIDLSAFETARVVHYNCQAGQIIPPPPTAQEVAAAREVAAAKAEVERKAAAEAAERNAEIAQAKAEQEDGERLRAATQKEQDRKLAPWTFTGSPAEFRVALTANLAKRAPEWGLDPKNYKTEFDRIDAIIATCMAITPDDWRRVQTQFDQEMEIAARKGGLNPVRLRDERLSWCDATRGSSVWGERISDPGKDHGLGIVKSMATIRSFKEGAVPTGYFEITVAVFPIKGELDGRKPLYVADLPPIVDVIKARIPIPGWPHDGATQ